MPDYTGSLIDHLNISVPDLARSLAFYEPALAAIGIVKVMAVPSDHTKGQPEMHGFGWPHKPFFWLIAYGSVGHNMHVAFTVEDRATVGKFWDAAGATLTLEPGVRPEYHPDYYGAFVLDPDGINVEAVCHRPN